MRASLYPSRLSTQSLLPCRGRHDLSPRVTRPTTWQEKRDTAACSCRVSLPFSTPKSIVHAASHSAVVCPRRGLFSCVCWSCVAGSVVGSDSTLSSTEHGDSSVLFIRRTRGVYTGGRSVNTISGVGNGAGGSCWKCTVAPAFDVERVRSKRCGWNDEGREFL